ncbi:hypothetical protein HK100_007607 [Physocladia obscura]|uniref:Uncharacterized protein n=1 Tax=Physocladia obscura TaxID=109957 RepID=A0AAD5TBZ0_9FUNG|nr:hypothetical protein HK100_007607 [Physocladia obscura]
MRPPGMLRATRGEDLGLNWRWADSCLWAVVSATKNATVQSSASAAQRKEFPVSIPRTGQFRVSCDNFPTLDHQIHYSKLFSTRSKVYRELKEKRKNIGLGILPETQQAQSPAAEDPPILVKKMPILIAPKPASKLISASVSSIPQRVLSSVNAHSGHFMPAAKSLFGSLNASTSATSTPPRHNTTSTPRRTQSCIPPLSVCPAQGAVSSVPSQSADTPQWPNLQNSNYSHSFPVRSATMYASFTPNVSTSSLVPSSARGQQEVPVMLPLSMRFQQQQQLEYEKKQKALYHQHNSEHNILSPISPIKNWPDFGSELAPSNAVSLVERVEPFVSSNPEDVEALCVANELVSFSRAASMSISKLVD